MSLQIGGEKPHPWAFLKMSGAAVKMGRGIIKRRVCDFQYNIQEKKPP